MKCSIFSVESGSQVLYINKYVILGFYGAILFSFSLNPARWDTIWSLTEGLKKIEKFNLSDRKVAA